MFILTLFGTYIWNIINLVSFLSLDLILTCHVHHRLFLVGGIVMSPQRIYKRANQKSNLHSAIMDLFYDLFITFFIVPFCFGFPTALTKFEFIYYTDHFWSHTSNFFPFINVQTWYFTDVLPQPMLVHHPSILFRMYTLFFSSFHFYLYKDFCWSSPCFPDKINLFISVLIITVWKSLFWKMLIFLW